MCQHVREPSNPSDLSVCTACIFNGQMNTVNLYNIDSAPAQQKQSPDQFSIAFQGPSAQQCDRPATGQSAALKYESIAPVPYLCSFQSPATQDCSLYNHLILSEKQASSILQTLSKNNIYMQIYDITFSDFV